MGWVIAAIGLMGGFLAWYGKVTIANALADFKETLRKEFWDAGLVAAKLEPMQKDIAHLYSRVNEVEDYAHKRAHDLSNEVQKCLLALERRREGGTD